MLKLTKSSLRSGFRGLTAVRWAGDEGRMSSGYLADSVLERTNESCLRYAKQYACACHTRVRRSVTTGTHIAHRGEHDH